MENQEIINEYEAAMFAANEAGYAGMTAEQVIRSLLERAEAAEAKASNLNDGWLNAINERDEVRAVLAELEKQQPVAYVHPAYLQPGALGFDASVVRLAPAQIPLFTRPAPAVSLTELVPDDTKRMDWLVSKVVNVRQPLPYGSRDIFWSQQSSEDCDENYTADLRDQIDAILRNIEPHK